MQGAEESAYRASENRRSHEIYPRSFVPLHEERRHRPPQNFRQDSPRTAKTSPNARWRYWHRRRIGARPAQSARSGVAPCLSAVRFAPRGCKNAPLNALETAGRRLPHVLRIPPGARKLGDKRLASGAPGRPYQPFRLRIEKSNDGIPYNGIARHP